MFEGSWKRRCRLRSVVLLPALIWMAAVRPAAAQEGTAPGAAPQVEAEVPAEPDPDPAVQAPSASGDPADAPAAPGTQTAPPASASAPPPPSSPPAPAAYATPAPEIASARQYEINALMEKRGKLMVSRRDYIGPAIGMGVSLTAFVVGAVVFARAWSDTYDYYGGYDDYNVAKDRAGLILMPVGAAGLVVSTTMTIIRVSRTRRLGRVDQRLHDMGVQVSAAPRFDRHGAGIGATLRF